MEARLISVKFTLGGSLAAALLFGCSSNWEAEASFQPIAQEPGGFVQPLLPPTTRDRTKSSIHLASRQWMARDAHNRDLLYVSGSDGNVNVYSWHAGRKLGTLTGFDHPQGLCVDAAGDVFVTNYMASNILEFAHGGAAPIKTLDDPGEYPVDCAVDPTTGDLAVTNRGSVSISIYKDASGKAKLYSVAGMSTMFFLNYDSSGNLFADGVPNRDGSFGLVELAVGARRFASVAVSGATINWPGGIQYFKGSLNIGDQNGEDGYSVLYRTSVSGSIATVTGIVDLRSTTDATEFSQSGPILAVPDASTSRVDFYQYPSGGEAKRILQLMDYTPIGTAVSKAKSKS